MGVRVDGSKAMGMSGCVVGVCTGGSRPSALESSTMGGLSRGRAGAGAA